MCDFKNDEPMCKCKRAVLKAYNDLLEHELPACFALQAATRVYRHHHPQDSKQASQLQVESWVNAGHFH